jgi:hypothetical protein
MDWTWTHALDLATSEVSDRVAFAWSYPCDEFSNQRCNDLYVLVDGDGNDPDFSLAFNLTNFIPADLAFLPDTAMANMDTLRAYDDLCLFFDQDDLLHVAFSTVAYFVIGNTTYENASIIWHWVETFPDEFQVICNAFDPENTIDCGVWNLRAQRPCLGQDPGTGYLYCMYQEYDVDSTHLSAAGWPSGEIYVSVSTDGGLNWSVGTNVTNTITPQNAPAGGCLSELTPSMAKTVDGECHIMYVLDRDAGFVIWTEGSWTLNDVIYHRLSVDSIPTTPLVPQDVLFHVQPFGPPPWQVELTPTTGTIFGLEGGTLGYNIAVENGGAVPVTFDVWVDVTLPNGNPYGPILGPVLGIYMPPGWSANRDRELTIPPNAPAGTYSLNGYIGEYPSAVHQDHFQFIKAGDDEGSGEWFLTDTGEPLKSYDGGSASAIQTTSFLVKNYPNPFNPIRSIRRRRSPSLCLKRLT